METNGYRMRRNKALALWAVAVLAAGLLLTVYWPPPPASVVWLTPAEFSKAMQPAPPTLAARIRNWFRQWVPRQSRAQSPEFDFRLQAFRTTATGWNISSSGLPVSTNSGGWRGWIVPAMEWSALHQSITSSSGTAYFRPMQVPGRSGGGRGSVELIGEPVRNYVYDFKAEPVQQGLKLTVFYRSDEGGLTNVSLAFSAPVPISGAVVLQKGNGGSDKGVTLLALDVLPGKARSSVKNRAAEPGPTSSVR